MKLHLSVPLALLTAFVIPQVTRAAPASKRQLFGTQKNAYEVFASAKGNLLFVGNDEEDAGFQVWSVVMRRPLWRSSAFFMAIARDEKTVLVATNAQPQDNKLRDLKGVRFDWLDARDGHVLRHMDAPSAPRQDEDASNELLDYRLSPDANTLHLATQGYLHVLSARDSVVQSQNWVRGKEYVFLEDAAFSTFNDQLIGFDEDDRLALFDAHSGIQLRRFAVKPDFNFPDSGFYLDLSPDGFSFVLNPDVDETQSRVFRLSDGKLLWRPANWPLFSDDGKRAYVLTKTGVDVLDAHTGTKLRTIAGPKDEAFDVSPDEKWIYEVSENKIYRWPLG